MLTCSTPQLIDILRDPPGGSSSAKISKGSTLKYSYQMDMSWKAGLSLGFSVGTKVNTFTGVVAAPMGGGATAGTNNNASSLLATSLDLVWSGSGQRAFSYTMTANEDISTSSHNNSSAPTVTSISAWNRTLLSSLPPPSAHCLTVSSV